MRQNETNVSNVQTMTLVVSILFKIRMQVKFYDQDHGLSNELNTS